jgi:excisionase family DNA binding protein
MNDLMTVIEVARMYRVSTMTVYRLIHHNELPAARIGKSFRVRRADAIKLLGIPQER